MAQVGHISENLEDYLERIFDLIKENGFAKVRDVAKKKGVKMSSVNDAVRRLAKEGLVTHDLYKNINLTESGAKLATELMKRHSVIKQFLTEVIGVKPLTADRDACAIEHHLHTETIDKLIKFFDKFDCQKPD